MFEDEQGVWQNRVDNLWIAVYGRAKLTDSVATALLNKITNGSLRAMAALEAAMTKPPPSQSDTNGTLARIIHIFEDNKSLLCYKHVD